MQGGAKPKTVTDCTAEYRRKGQANVTLSIYAEQATTRQMTKERETDKEIGRCGQSVLALRKVGRSAPHRGLIVARPDWRLRRRMFFLLEKGKEVVAFKTNKGKRKERQSMLQLAT